MASIRNLHPAVWLVLWLPACVSVYVTDLTGTWTVFNKERGLNVSGQVPGSMYTALLSHHVIQDPYYRDNDVSYRWIGRTDWTYSRTFTLSEDAASRLYVQLVCDGLDTFATVYVNDKPVGKASNMFHRHVFDVKNAVRSDQDNTIRVEFQSAVAQAAAINSTMPYEIPPECPAPVQHGECHVNMIRKEQCSFSWDWGPSFPTQGIWKNIFIQSYDTAVLQMLTALPRKTSDGIWSLDVEAYFDTQGTSSVEGLLTTYLDDFNIKMMLSVSVSSTNNRVAFNISIFEGQKVEAWWPNGYGNQTLYPLRAEFQSRVGGDVSSRTIRVGFRTVELVQDQVTSDPKKGETFYFKINGLPIFFKGTNWIPADSFQERITRARLENLFQSAADVHINSMRVWGGGVYESEDFYDLADEYGIMIWQDLMFSDALYPSTTDFLLSVREEIIFQLRRLKHHSCIAVWSGNNENEGILNAFRTQAHFDDYYEDYVELYVSTIMPLVTAADSTRPFVTSSPSNGDETKTEGWVAKDPGSELWGDIHFYDYNSDLWNPNNFRISRFTSEFGVQAWCSLDSLQSVFAPADLDYWSNMSDHRQHHSQGNQEMLSNAAMQFSIPNGKDKKQLFSDLIYLTQINQAMSIRTETEHYRRWQSRLGSDGRGLTMGALYWQLNDIWQAPTWASLEYSGKWKMLHYYAQHFFQPALVSPYLTKDGMLDVFVVVDEIPVEDYRDPHSGTVGFRPQPGFSRPVHPGHTTQAALAQWSKTAAVLQGSVVLSVFSWSSFSPLKSWTLPYKLNSTADSIFTRNLTELVTEAGCPDVSSCFLLFSSNFSSDTWLPLTPMKNAKGLSRAQVRVTQVQQTSPMEFLLTLSSDHVTPFVWLDAGPLPGRFGDNGFLMTSATHSVTFQAWAPTQTSTLQQSLSVLSLMDIYHRDI